jgi:IclR family transcriptional regulator, KDG regulon repressor
MNKLKNQEASSVQSVDRAITLLKIIAESRSPILVGDLADQTNLNRTTVYRLLSTLESHDLVERDSFTKGYQLGYASTRLVSGSAQYAPLIRRAFVSMERLRDEIQETVLLSVPRPLGVLTIEQINPSHSIRIADYVNMTSPLHCTSNGKILLSRFSKNEFERFLQRPLDKITPFTNTDPEHLRKEIDLVHECGYGTTFGEIDENENGISAPISDQNNNLVALLTVAGPSFRFTKEKVLDSAQSVMLSAKEIAQTLQ